MCNTQVCGLEEYIVGDDNPMIQFKVCCVCREIITSFSPSSSFPLSLLLPPSLFPSPSSFPISLLLLPPLPPPPSPSLVYQHIRRPAGKGIPPKLTLISKSSLQIELEPETFIPPTVPRKEVSKAPKSESLHLRDSLILSLSSLSLSLSLSPSPPLSLSLWYRFHFFMGFGW